MPYDPRYPAPGRFYLSSINPKEVTLSDKPNVSTPEPVVKAGLLYGSIATVVVSVVGAAVTLGVLSAEQADAINALNTYIATNIVPLGTSMVAIVSVVSGLVSHIVTSFTARSKVVPVDSDVYRVVPATEAATPVGEV